MRTSSASAGMLLLLLSFSVRAQVTQEWIARQSGTGSNSDNAIAAIADSVGNVYVTGTCRFEDTGDDYVTIKYDSAGQQVWRARFDSPNRQDDYAMAMTRDADGNVYVTGYGEGTGGYYDCYTVKYDPAGVQLWMAQYDGIPHWDDGTEDIAVDAEGNVYVAGSTINGFPSGTDFLTIKYNSAGIQQWCVFYDCTGSFDLGLAMTLDNLGNIYVTGFSDQAAWPYIENEDYATIKYDPDGQVQWVARYDGLGGSWDQPTDIVCDNDGNVYVTGWCWNGDCWSGLTDDDYATIKYDSSGSEQWVAQYNGPANGQDQAQAIAVDAEGNVYVTGHSNGTTFMDPVYDYATIKYDASGVEQWVQRYDGPASGEDWGKALALDEAANVYVTGCSQTTGNALDYATLKYSSAGAQQWIITYDGSAGGSDQALALAVNAAGEIFVTGTSWDSLTNFDYATVHYHQQLSGVSQFPAGATPQEFALLQPFPNPFNPSTVASFELRVPSQVSLKVYDTTGRLVATLVDGLREEGAHEVTFDGAGLPSGIYVYRLTAGEFSSSGKMVLLK